jgi:hypothetical protein
MSGRNVFVERLSRSVKYEDLYLRAYNLGGHPKPANGGHLKTGQRT